MTRRLVILFGVVALLAGLVAAVAVWAGPAAAPETVTVSVSGTIVGNDVTYTITVRNTGTTATGDIYVAGSIPTGASFSSATTPTGSQFVGSAGGVAAWLATSIPAGGSLSLSYTVARGTATDLTAQAFASWKAPSEGTAVSAPATPAVSVPRRGCLACHVKVFPDGRFTLPYEAHDRAEAAGGKHPTVSPSGVSIQRTDQVGPKVCLECHAAGTGARKGRGVIAPLMLRDIVHPAHLFSPIFTGADMKGNCFSCHNVDGEGQFDILSERVDVNEKGVPNPNKIPIPGQLDPS